MRDPKTEEAKRHINQGVKIKMDEQGNILIKRLCKNNVYVKSTNQEDNAIGPEIIRNSQGALEHEKPGKVKKKPPIAFFANIRNHPDFLLVKKTFVGESIEAGQPLARGVALAVSLN